MNFQYDLSVFVREVLQNSLDARCRGGGPVRVILELSTLTGADKQAFLAQIDWRALRSHVDAARALVPALRDAIQRCDDPGVPLQMLSIHDGPALGLSGPERGEGRFAMFARNKLLSDKERSDAGGSFGLGKSVLWAFSGISTVFVNSIPRDAEAVAGASRCIGIAQLPWHAVDGRPCDGPGWFGTARTDRGEQWSASFEAEDDRLQALGLKRAPELGTGTSIAVPDLQVEGEPSEIAAALERAAAVWFWPAMVGAGRWLEVEIRCGEDRRVVDPLAQQDLRPFLHLAELAPHPVWTPRTVTGTEPLRLPAVRETMRGHAGFRFHDSRQIEEAIRLDALQLEHEAGELSKNLALVRGARMVVRYVRLHTDRPTFALARAGTARGEMEGDSLVEQLLRHAEPPSHDDWDPHAPKLHDRYKRGYVAELKGLKKRLADAALVLLRKHDRERTEHEVPAALRRAMAVSVGATRAEPERAGRFDYRVTDCRLVTSGDDAGWQFSGWVQSTRPQPWLLEVRGWLEGDGERIALPVRRLHVGSLLAKDAGDRVRIDGHGRFDFAGFCSIQEQGEVAECAVFGVHLRQCVLDEDGGEDETES